MILLFITQKLTGQDAFVVLWIRAFIKAGYQVKVLCLQGPSEPFEFEVHSMGKEQGRSKLGQILEFFRKVATLHYDRIFIHMTPIWAAVGMPIFVIRRTPTYLWYTHYKMQLGVRLFGWYGKRFFCATAQSLPQFEGSPKKIIVGHGIATDVWMKRQNQCKDPHRLLMVHRLSRSKRIEIPLHALTFLPSKYTLDIYGIEPEPQYIAEMKHLVAMLKLSSRVTFHGTIPMSRLPEIYVRHALILNMASETIDKTMLEAMTCGCYPVTTKANAEAVGIPFAPGNDTPQAVAEFVRRHSHELPLSPDAMYEAVKNGHSLSGLIEKMDCYMSKGL